MRGEQVGAGMQALTRRIERLEQELSALSAIDEQPGEGDGDAQAGEARIAALEAELAELADRRAQEVGSEVAELESALSDQRLRVEQVEAELADAVARASWPTPRWRACASASRRPNAPSRTLVARPPASAPSWRRPTSSCVGTRASAAISRMAPRGRSARICAFATATSSRSRRRSAAGSTPRWSRTSPARSRCWTVPAPTEARRCSPAPGAKAAAGAGRAGAPANGAERLLDLVSGPAEVLELAGRLLGDAWVVARLEDLPSDFAGIGVTRSGACGSRAGARCAS